MTKDDHELVERYKKHYTKDIQQKVGLSNELHRNVKQIYCILYQLKTHGVIDDDGAKEYDDNAIIDQDGNYSCVEFIEHLQSALCQLDLLSKWKQQELIKDMHDEAGLDEDGYPKKMRLH